MVNWHRQYLLHSGSADALGRRPGLNQEIEQQSAALNRWSKELLSGLLLRRRRQRAGRNDQDIDLSGDQAHDHQSGVIAATEACCAAAAAAVDILQGKIDQAARVPTENASRFRVPAVIRQAGRPAGDG